MLEQDMRAYMKHFEHSVICRENHQHDARVRSHGLRVIVMRKVDERTMEDGRTTASTSDKCEGLYGQCSARPAQMANNAPAQSNRPRRPQGRSHRMPSLCLLGVTPSCE